MATSPDPTTTLNRLLAQKMKQGTDRANALAEVAHEHTEALAAYVRDNPGDHKAATMLTRVRGEATAATEWDGDESVRRRHPDRGAYINTRARVLSGEIRGDVSGT